MYWKTAYQLGVWTFGDIVLAIVLLAFPLSIICYGLRFNRGQRYINIAVISSIPLWLFAVGWVAEDSLIDEFKTGSNAEVIEGMVTSLQRAPINGHRGVRIELSDRTIHIEQGIRARCLSPTDFEYKEGSFLKLHILWLSNSSEKVKEQSPCVVKVEHWVCHEPPFEDYTYNCKKETWPKLSQSHNL